MWKIKDPPALSGKYKNSFAYITIKDRLPVILTNVIDQLCRHKVAILQKYGEGSSEELKEVIANLSQLKSELQTDKSYKYINDDKIWNNEIKYLEELKINTWFTSSWLFAECYMYRKIYEFFNSRKLLKNYDPFLIQKQKSTENALESIRHLNNFLMGFQKSLEIDTESVEPVTKMIEMSLWGNQFDLSLSAGEISSCDDHLAFAKSSEFQLIESRPYILVNETDNFLLFLRSLLQNKKVQRERELAIILDNSGLELISDFCLADMLLSIGAFSSVTFYVKSIPWFVSDTLKIDVKWTLEFLEEKSKACEIGDLVKRFQTYFNQGVWKLIEDDYWTSFHDFSAMKKIKPQLYSELSRYSLLIFKGDLNYRKLTGDLDWPVDVSLKKSLRGFLPCPMLVLRTLKGGPTVGLNTRSAHVLKALEKKDWGCSGKYGVIQFIDPKEEFCYRTILLVFAAVVPILSFVFKKFVNFWYSS